MIDISMMSVLSQLDECPLAPPMGWHSMKCPCAVRKGCRTLLTSCIILGAHSKKRIRTYYDILVWVS